MSFVKRSKAQPTASSFHLSLVPAPSEKFSESQSVAQQDIINQVTKASKGLFHPNPAVEVDGSLKSKQNYASGVSVQELANTMNEYKLVLRVKLQGDHQACAMATANDIISNGLIQSPTGTFSLNTGKYIKSVDFL